MGLSRAQNLLLGLCIMFAFMCTFHITVYARRTTITKSERLSPPLDIQLHTVNCTAFRVQWKMPWRSARAISGYKVFYTEMNTLPVSRTVTLEVPLNLDVLTTGHFDGQASFDVVVGKLKVATPYRVSVGAYGRAGDSRPSMPKNISTASHEICVPPSPPTQPLVVAISDTELALSWQQNEIEESAPVLYFLVAYIRPEMDTEWTYIREPVESNTMVLKGLLPETEHQFVVRSVNAHGTSPPSSLSSPVRTLRTADVGSGDIYITNFENKYGFDSDDSDYDIFIEELKPFPVVSTNSRRSQLRARIGSPVNADFIYRTRNTPDPRNTPTPQNTNFTSNIAIWTTPGTRMATTATSSPTTNTATTAISTVRSTPNTATTTIATPCNNPIPTTTTTTTSTPSINPIPITTTTTLAIPSNNPIPTTATTTLATPSNNPIPTTTTTTPATHSTSPIPTSFCTEDHRGGSRCHCNLGYQGDRCSEGVTVKFPRFYGYSHMTFEPLKNSYLHFHITLEFKADSKDGLLLYCGENVDGRGDFTSLALIGAKLHYRFNCGTGAAQIVSESSVLIGQWHIISLFREGVNGWMRLDNDAPVSGSSQGHYTKITFRTPLYVGGAPTTYRLVRTVGTNQGFQGCVQSLSINSKSTALRPWPHGEALAGADIGECSSSVCDEVTCLNGGVCSPTRADGYICLCSLGYRGDHCEESFVLSLPQFNESLHSYASAPWPLSSSSYLSFMEFHITFRPVSEDGILLYSHDTTSPDFLSISLVGGFVEVRFDCGSGAAIIRSEKTVSMNSWHELHVSRTAKNGILQVDDHQPVEGSAEGAFTQIRCSSPLYIGGVPDDISKRSMGVLRGFTGAVQKITLNDHAVAMTLGVNVLNALHLCVENPCANGGTCRPQRDGYDCDCRLGYDGKHCQKECGNYCLNTVTENIEIPQFTGRSYLTYDNPHILKRVSGSRTNMFIRFKSTSKDGLLLWRGESPMRVNSDYLSLGLQNGALVFSFNLGSGAAVVEVNGTFSDGKWHRVKAVREGPFGKLTVDDYGSKTGRSTGKMRQLNCNGVLYIGGMKEIVLHTSRHHHGGLAGLVGCISHFTLATDFHVALVDDAADGKNINTCTN